MTRLLLTCALVFTVCLTMAQTKKPKMVVDFWDFEKTQMRSKGFYYADDFYGESTLEHGKWEFWDRQGRRTEILNYQKGKLHGKSTTFYANGKKKEEGFFKDGKQDSIYFAWHENGQLWWEYNYKDGKNMDY